MQVDISDSLANIRDRYQGRLVPQLLEIQEHGVMEQKSREWVESLQCLRRFPSCHDKILGRKRISCLSGVPYIAVSYPWNPSPGENCAVEGYEIESATGEGCVPSKVRDIVLDRVILYAQHQQVDLIWIDGECINQDDPKEQEKAIQSMDLVYSHCHSAVGLLSVVIESQWQLEHLLSLLRGNFIVKRSPPQAPLLHPAVSPETASDVLKLLKFITSDQWWDRAWIFQEDYLSSVKMHLLIRHSPRINKKDGPKELGNIPGELRLKSAYFRKASTLFCLAYRQNDGPQWDHGHADCQKILEMAGKYNILYRYKSKDGGICKSMSPTIFKDIGRRQITEASDRLAIAANSCSYSVRLDSGRLTAVECSLSLCILALYLLNGEIIRNDDTRESPLSGNIFRYLEDQSLDNFDPPVGEKELSFLKYCRFDNVNLSADGIVTTGCLWKLGREICISESILAEQFQDPKRDYRSGLNQYQRWRLWQLALELESRNYSTVAQDIYKYMDEDAKSNEDDDLPSRAYMDLMAEEVVQAIKERKSMRLGCLVGDNPYRGIFISSPSCQEPYQHCNSGDGKHKYVFTAWRPTNPDDGLKRGIDKIVSLEVSLDGLTSQRLPRLRTKRWMNGLCFYKRSSRIRVVFPWPSSLEGMG